MRGCGDAGDDTAGMSPTGSLLPPTGAGGLWGALDAAWRGAWRVAAGGRAAWSRARHWQDSHPSQPWGDG